MKEFNYLVIVGGKKATCDYSHDVEFDNAKISASSALDDGYKWAIVYDRAKMEVIYETYVHELARKES